MNTLSLALLATPLHQVIADFSFGLHVLLLFVTVACAFSRRAMLLGVGFGLMALSLLLMLLFNLGLRYEVSSLDGSMIWVWSINGLFQCVAMAVILIGVLQLPKADRFS